MNKLIFLGYKKDLKGYTLWDPKNKKFVSSRHVTLEEASMVKPTISQAGGGNGDQVRSITAGGG